MTLHGIDRLSPELRETRLRTRVDELNHLLRVKQDENSRLRHRVEKQQLRLTAMRADQQVMVDQINRLERSLARARAGRETVEA